MMLVKVMMMMKLMMMMMVMRMLMMMMTKAIRIESGVFARSESERTKTNFRFVFRVMRGSVL